MHTLADPMLANFAAAFASHASRAQSAANAEFGGFRAFDAGLDNPEFNVVLPDPPGSQDLPLPDIEGWFASRGTSFRVLVREPDDIDLVEHLVARGYARQSADTAMLLTHLRDEVAQVEGVSITEVEDEAGALAYARAEPDGEGDLDIREQVALADLGAPYSRMFVASVDGQPVARALAYLTGEMMGLYNVYVREEYRRRGLGSAISMVALASGAEAGATSATLAATENARPLYRRMGFETVFDLAAYAPPPESN